MSVYKSSILLLFICVVFTSFINDTDEWVLQKHSDNVWVYSRNLDNYTIKELKAVTQIKTSLSSIVALLNDREECPKWVYKCEKSYIIKKITNWEYYSYQNMVAPWPIDNRDIVLHIRVSQDKNTKEVIHKAESEYNYLPPTEDHVRIKVFNSTWVLTPLKNGFINCENHVFVDPGGSLPTWLVNMAAVDGPFETTTNFRKQVMTPKYQKAKLHYIKEFD
jgi:hypothetical protein